MTGGKEKRSGAEKLSSAVSLLLLAGVVGGILYIGLTPAESPARFRVEPGVIRSEPGFFSLYFQVFNEGDETGKKVKVTGRVAEETASTVFDYIPGHSTERGVLVFRRRPGGALLQVESYQRP